MLLAYQVDGGMFYWEIYTNNTHTYIATVEDEDMGDWIAQHRKEKGEDVILFPQEPYQAMYDIHIELDKWWGQPDDHLDDCDSIHDPMNELDYFCQGCKAFQKYAEGKYYGDYWKMIMNRKVRSYV